MITSITLENFQAHKRLVVPLDQGVTVILGPSDIGKSAVIRALEWVTTNRPTGDAYIRDDARTATVTLDVDSHTIKRVKGAEGNIYVVDDDEKRAFGTDVPEAVGNILMLGDINFQGQHDGPFWFSESAPEISRQLNRIINLQVIDTTLANLASALRTAHAEEQVCAGRYKAAVLTRRAFRFVPRFEKDVHHLERLNERVDKKTVAVKALAKIVGDAQTIQWQNTERTKETRAADELYEAGRRWSELYGHVQGIGELLSTADAEGPKAARVLPDIAPIEAMGHAWGRARAQACDLGQLVMDAEGQMKLQECLADRVNEADVEFEELMGDACPLCGQSLEGTQ
jgi:AAA domain